MKQNVSPVVLISVIAVAVLLFGAFVYRTMTAPSAVPAPAAQAGKRVPNPRDQEHGPNEEELKKIREYLAAHPEAQSKYR